jgi:hypothetical protein
VTEKQDEAAVPVAVDYAAIEDSIASELEPDSDDTGAEPDEDTTDDGATDDEDDDETGAEENGGIEAQPDTEAALEGLTKQLERRAQSYGKSLATILGDDWHGLVPCPLCAEHFPGLLTPAPPSEETIAAIRPLIGLPDFSNYVPDTFARQCNRCSGRGKTLTGSQVPEYATMRCKECNGTGFVSAEAGFDYRNGTASSEPVPAPTHEENPEAPALPPDAIIALERMLASAQNRAQ